MSGFLSKLKVLVKRTRHEREAERATKAQILEKLPVSREGRKGRQGFPLAVAEELRSARSLHGPITGTHDGYGRILEEVDEFWEQVKLRKELRNRKNMFRELVQIAAMAQRTAEDLDLVP